MMSQAMSRNRRDRNTIELNQKSGHERFYFFLPALLAAAALR
jgi:hypothetical protein